LRPTIVSLPPRADLRQPRILQDLDAPALVFRQVPVEHVEAVEREQIDVSLDEIDREEMPRGVEVHAAVCEARRVVDAN
jgi:hypothetical protein